MTSTRVVFMGSPRVAVPTLEALAAAFCVPLVVTQPDRPKGRGRIISPTPVHAKADELGIDVMPAPDVNLPMSVERIGSENPDAIVVVSFGQILKRPLLEMPPLGCLNVHFSILPALRGAAPISWAIINGMESTGASVIRMVRKMDAGPVCAEDSLCIRPGETASSLADRLAPLGARLIIDVLKDCLAGSARPVEQDGSLATFAPKITRETAAVDWTLPAGRLDCLVRGLSGQLEAFAFLESSRRTRVAIYDSALLDEESPGAGMAARGPSGELLVGCGSGLIEIKEIQAEGRRRVSGRDFANGYHIAGGERFSNGR